MLQIGGSDQMGNIVSGHDLISRVEEKSVYGEWFVLIKLEQFFTDKFHIFFILYLVVVACFQV